MHRRRLSDPLVRDVPVLAARVRVGDAVRQLVDVGVPALPVADRSGRLCGVFGEREFFTALFPGYVSELRFAGFVRKGLDEALEKRAACRSEPVGRYMTSDHVDVPEDASDLQVAETFLHHRVLILPVIGNGGVKGVITRRDFFTQLAGRFLEP